MGDLRVLKPPDNADAASDIRAFADRIDEEGRAVRGYALVAVYSDGTAGSSYGGDELAILGGFQALTHRILGEWVAKTPPPRKERDDDEERDPGGS